MGCGVMYMFGLCNVFFCIDSFGGEEEHTVCVLCIENITC